MNQNTGSRRTEIARILGEKKVVRNSDLAQMFNVTNETIRKDIIYLEKYGLAEKRHGKSYATQECINDFIHLDLRIQRESNTKQTIAKLASQFLKHNTVIFIDAGSTVLELAKLINDYQNILVVTNSLAVANIIAKQPQNKVYITAGFVNYASLHIDGPYCLDSFKDFEFAISFMGTNGLNSFHGPTSNHYEFARIKKAVLQLSQKVILLCDHRKFMNGSLMQYGKWKDIDYLITDQIPSNFRSTIEKDTTILTTE